LTDLGAQLQAIHQLVLQQPRQFVLVAEEHKIDSFSEQMEDVFADRHNPVRTTMADSQIDYFPALDAKSQCWATNTQVSFCAKAYPTVASTHPDAAALTVLGGVLRNGFLHRKIREQGGAYGGGAAQDNHSGAFRFFSYRDPRIKGTLQDFDASIQWLLEDPLEDHKIEEAVLGVIGNLDKPASPAGEAISAFHGELNGRDKISLTDFRRRILGVSREDLKRVAATYLRPEKAFEAVITNSELGAKTGMEMCDV
jgi:hypothetical protein